ncbi:UDP-N-acetylglucosamine--N-acetylmuramyl-(pentapeptide) pyrophosphoryl-undecaprenol N-acetylglucosamine transferase [Candidatus Pelagibacter sp.]|nr:UDP-N-acetylglucosamine--N-acetylmuramyl-(pentapeptide) pyrophosphoryl-undecaprenol N-acetylglucosamine transferase [Candidatus Pelagibacter sp.]
MKKNILVSTGGSGGHVIPATILYEHLKDKFNISMASDNRGIQFLDRNKYTIKIFNVPKISKNIFLLPFQIFLILNLIIKSFLFLKKEKIQILISTGGYMSLPLCFASKILNVQLFLFEPNMVLGRSNKLFISSCVKIFCYSNKIKNFSNKLKNKITLIPPLLRKEFYSTKINEDIDKVINLLIIGGSQGAKLFDIIIRDSIIDLSKKYTLKVFHQTNLNNYTNLKNFYLKNKIENELFDFSEDVSKFMSKSNVCITRAGASTLAELIFLNIPHIAIPLPTAKDNHQFENASFYQQLGCNWILEQDKITSTNLTNKLINIIENKEEYLSKKKNMVNFSYQNSWNNINQKIITTINEN